MSSPHLDVKTQEDDTSFIKSVQLSPPGFSHLTQNGKEMARDSGPGGSCLSRSDPITFPIDPGVHAQAFQQQLIQLKKQQQLQRQILLQHYQSQQQQLAEQHERQLRQHLKEFREQQKALEEQHERLEKERMEKLNALKKKDKHEQSAIASSEVKQRLQGFLLNKKQREAANGTGSPFRQNWGEPPPAHPYHLNPLVPVGYEDDFPLRKTASEPNLLKVRLKQRVIERRASPLAYHRQRNLRQQALRNKALANSSSSADNGGTSPSLITGLRTSPSAGGNTPIREEPESPPYYIGAVSAAGGSISSLPNSTVANMTSGGVGAQSTQGSLSDLSLYSSPSMPNISLGRPPSQTQTPNAETPMQEEETFSTRMTGTSVTGRLLGSTLPFYPAINAMESDSSPVESNNVDGLGLNEARLHKAGHRPLGRTQSAPLPLGHPMLQGTTADSRHNLLKQQIRATVLTRAGRHLEETVDETAEVIDLTRNSNHSSQSNSLSELSRQQKDRQLFLQQQRDLMMRHTMQMANESCQYSPPPPPVAHHHPHLPPRPLSRALSSPLVHLPANSSVGDIPSMGACTTGLAFDSLMLKHACVCGDNAVHPEHGGRLQSVWARLVETGLAARCGRIRARKASVEELLVAHCEAHVMLFGTNPLNRQKLDMSKLSTLPIKSFVRLPCGGVGVDSDTTWNELHTAPAARMAVGCVVDLAFKVASGDMRNGFAVVRPPGHHAEASQAMGFCFFNSVAIAAKLLLQRLHLNKIFILDWDVHHGNGTQQQFYEEPRVLYMSLHRHDNGNFFPGTGGPEECGAAEGVGFNVNIAFSGGLQPPMADAEYLAAFRTVVMPIAKEFEPDIVLVSAGFDAAAGHPPPLGGYLLSSACFGYMTQQLMTLANGKVVLALEGGYDLPSICDAAQECTRALLGDNPSPIQESELTRSPCDAAIDTLRKTVAVQRTHWPILDRLAHTIGLPYMATEANDERSVSSRMAGLSVGRGGVRFVRSPREESNEPEAMEEDEGK